jgi:hypothetical protein
MACLSALEELVGLNILYTSYFLYFDFLLGGIIEIKINGQGITSLY